MLLPWNKTFTRMFAMDLGKGCKTTLASLGYLFNNVHLFIGHGLSRTGNWPQTHELPAVSFQYLGYLSSY